jgi:hypothetical protein
MRSDNQGAMQRIESLVLQGDDGNALFAGVDALPQQITGWPCLLAHVGDASLELYDGN